jgi:hypothetical protein
MDSSSVLGQWIAHSDRELKGAVTGFHALKGAKPNQTEAEAMKRLADASGKRVVALPEIPPESYPGGPQPPGPTHPDSLWGEELCEFKEIRGGSAFAQVKYIGAKSRQANTAVVTFAQDSRLATADILPQMERLWAHPDYVYLKQIVFLTDKGMQVVARPAPYILTFTQGVARVPYPTARVYNSVVDSVQAEQDGEPTPPVR